MAAMSTTALAVTVTAEACWFAIGEGGTAAAQAKDATESGSCDGFKRMPA